MKYSLEILIAEVNLGDFVCTSFKDAQNNDRRKNIVIIDDSNIYFTYKTQDGCLDLPAE